MDTPLADPLSVALEDTEVERDREGETEVEGLLVATLAEGVAVPTLGVLEVEWEGDKDAFPLLVPPLGLAEREKALAEGERVLTRDTVGLEVGDRGPNQAHLITGVAAAYTMSPVCVA